MRKRPVITEALAKQIEDLAASMKKPSAGKIANKLGLKHGTVYWYLLFNGLISRKPASYANKPYVRNGRTIYPYSAEQDEFILARRAAGDTFAVIAAAATKKFGIQREAHSVQVRIIMLAAVDDESEAA